MIMGDHWAEMDHIVFIENDPVQIGDAGYIDQRFSIFSKTTFDFKDQVGAARNNTRVIRFF
jgi:hypothetical protein